MIMSRRRLLLVWLILFTVVILAYIYLPFHATNFEVQDHFVIPTQSKYNYHQDIPQRTLPNETVNLKILSTTQPTRNNHLQESTTTLLTKTTAGPTKPKLCEPELLVGPVYCNKTVPKMQEVIEQLSSDYNGLVKKGGVFTPTECIAKNKLAIVIPYRNRSQHLRIFLRHMHPIMQRQMHDYRIIVVEQAGNYSFNRAQLLNIGFLEALKISDYQCFVFHDVDHILENDQNDYGCPESPKLLGVSIDRFNRRWPYQKYFGGVGAFSKDQFEKMNGYSNLFWGWGGEDDDAYNRIRAAGYSLTRPRANIGRYIMLKEHHHRDKPGGNRYMLLKTSAKRMYTDGLNSIKYKILNIIEFPLYTHILAKLYEELDVMPNITSTITDSPII